MPYSARLAWCRSERSVGGSAVLTALTLRIVFRLPLCQTEGDGSTLPDLLKQIEAPIRRFTADGAYDHKSVYDQVSAAGTEDVVNKGVGKRPKSRRR